jgi:hypothetical protein
LRCVTKNPAAHRFGRKPSGSDSGRRRSG